MLCHFIEGTPPAIDLVGFDPVIEGKGEGWDEDGHWLLFSHGRHTGLISYS